MSLKKKITDKALSLVSKHIENNFKAIPKEDMVLGTGLFNQRCNANTTQNAYEKGYKLFLVYAIEDQDKTDVIVHVINQNTEGKYVDTTLGYMYLNHTYYIVREIGLRTRWGNFLAIEKDLIFDAALKNNKILHLMMKKILYKNIYSII